MISIVERALSPLDAARGAALHFAAGIPPLRQVITHRNIRVPLGLTIHALVAFAIALLIPSLSLVVAPIVLGVPHVASDIRHLVLRRGLPLPWLWVIAVFGGILVVLRLVPVLNPWSPDRIVLEHAIASSWVLLGALLGTANGGLRKQSMLAIVMALLVGGLSLLEPRSFRMVLAHAHNLVAILLWIILFRGAPRSRAPSRTRGAKGGMRSSVAWSLGITWVPVVVVLAGGAWLASGRLLDFTMRHGVLSVFGLHLFFAARLACSGRSRSAGRRLGQCLRLPAIGTLWNMAVGDSAR